MKLLLVDGHYYLYRSFFAIRGLKNSAGEPTNAIYGFTKALRRMVADVVPDFGAVVWDAGLPERRTELQPAYKQQRPAMPDEMRPQESAMQRIAPLVGLESVWIANTEADDLIASYAAQFDGDVVIATNDKDILQIVDERVKIYSTAKADLPPSGGSFALLGAEQVTKKWGVEPTQIADVLALTGDSSDNIPGVNGIGQKTAAALIREFGSVANLLARVGEISSARTRERLLGAATLVQQNREMVELDRDLKVPVPIDNLSIEPDYPRLLEEMKRCEFKGLLAEIEKEFRARDVGPAGGSAAESPEADCQGELFFSDDSGTKTTGG